MPDFHTIKASAALSGINVSLRDGAIFAENMSLSKLSLEFKEEKDQVFHFKRNTPAGTETVVEHLETTLDLRLNKNGLFYGEDYKINDFTGKMETFLGPFGMRFSRMNDVLNVSRTYETYIGIGAMAFEMTELDDKRHWLEIDPTKLTTETAEFAIKNITGSLVIDGKKGVTIETNASSLYLKGNNMLTLETGGFNNMYLSIEVYDNASSEYKPFLIPLMSPFPVVPVVPVVPVEI